MGFINSIEIHPVSFPLKKPFSNHLRKITQLNGLVVEVMTNSDIKGQSVIYGLSNISYNEIIKNICDDLIPGLLNNREFDEANSLHTYWNKFWSDYKNQNIIQEKLYALAAIDIAVWDIFTKANNISLHKYLGGAQSKIPVYGTTGWLSLSLDELIEECKYYSDKGINAFKVRVGHNDDSLRIKTLRNEMGNDFILMLDANQRYSVEQAVQLADELSEFNITWIEEPTNNSVELIEKIKKTSKIPIALGENIIDENDFKKICEKKLSEYLQPDLPRCGGITGFIKIIEMASRYKLPVCNHLMYELSAGLLAAFPNGYMLEYDNLLPSGLFTYDFSINGGCLRPPNLSGTGVEMTEKALKEYSLDSYIFKPSPAVRRSF